MLIITENGKKIKKKNLLTFEVKVRMNINGDNNIVDTQIFIFEEPTPLRQFIPKGQDLIMLIILWIGYIFYIRTKMSCSMKYICDISVCVYFRVSLMYQNVVIKLWQIKIVLNYNLTLVTYMQTVKNKAHRDSDQTAMNHTFVNNAAVVRWICVRRRSLNGLLSGRLACNIHIACCSLPQQWIWRTENNNCNS